MFIHKKPGMNVDHSSSSKLAGLLDKIDQSRESSGSNDAAKEAFVAPIEAGEIQYGWVEYFDPASQLPYYYNVILKTTQWAKPNVLEVSIEKSQNASQQEYTEKAYFSKESGKFSGTSSYWQKVTFIYVTYHNQLVRHQTLISISDGPGGRQSGAPTWSIYGPFNTRREPRASEVDERRSAQKVWIKR